MLTLSLLGCIGSTVSPAPPVAAEVPHATAEAPALAVEAPEAEAQPVSEDPAPSLAELDAPVKSRFRAKTELIPWVDDDGEEWEDYRVVVRGPGREVLWSHEIPQGGAGAMVVSEDGETVLLFGDDQPTTTVLKRGQAAEALGSVGATVGERAWSYEAEGPSGGWLLSAPVLHAGDVVSFTTRSNWRFIVDLNKATWGASRVPQPFELAGETLFLNGYYLGFGDPDVFVHDQDGVSVTRFPKADDPVAVLSEGDYDGEDVTATEIWGREAAQGRHMVTMGCAVKADEGVLLFELNPTGVSGCDIILIAADFAPIVEAVFGEDISRRR